MISHFFTVPFDFWEVGIVITFIFCGTASKNERNYKAYVHTGYRQ